MFCPSCGSLAYTNENHWCKCPDYKCGYEGTAVEQIETSTGNIVNLRKLFSRTVSTDLYHLLEVFEPPTVIFDHIGAVFDIEWREMMETPFRVVPGYG